MSKDNPFKIQEGSIRDGKVSSFLKGRKSGDYLDFGGLGRAEHVGRFFDTKKIRYLFIVFGLFLLVLFGRAFYLQIIQGSHFRDISEGNRIRSNIIKANRGLIYDRFGNLLVKNISYFFLYINPEIFPEDELDRQALLNNLANVLELERDELDARIFGAEKNSGDVLVYEDVPYEEAIKLMIMSEHNPAIKISYEPRRQYFSNLGLSHAMGYLGAVTEDDLNNRVYHSNDRIGKSGLEYVYESNLKGQDGVRQIEVDALFREKNVLSITEPVDGQDIILTIDAKAQEKLYEIMQDQSARYDKPKMAAIVLDPNDGGVLAMASLPNFDNNIFTTILNKEEYNKIIEDENNPLLNRVVAGTYPLGSIFKMIVGAAALEEGIINDRFTVNSTGGITVGSNFFPDWRPGGHGLTDIYWAIADSVNTFFYSIGGGNNQWLSLGLGVDKIIDYAKKFGLGKATNIDITAEANGFLPSKDWKVETFAERWYLGDTYNLSIGQGFLLATPVQAAVYTSYFANNGIAYQPHFIKEIEQNGTIKSIEPKIALTNVVSSDNLKVIRGGLRQTITQGTAQSLQSVPVKVAGKTGTAQFNRNKTPHSWMAAFAPYDDPKIVTVVLVEEGGDVGLAVTITRQFMEWYFSQ